MYLRSMLHFMQPKAESVPSSAPTDFAGLLASLASPAKKNARAWSEEISVDELASVSYEKALRMPARSYASQDDAQSANSEPSNDSFSEASAEVAETDSAASVRAALQQAIAALGQNASSAPGATPGRSSVVHANYTYEEQPERSQWLRRPLAGKLGPEPPARRPRKAQAASQPKRPLAKTLAPEPEVDSDPVVSSEAPGQDVSAFERAWSENFEQNAAATAKRLKAQLLASRKRVRPLARPVEPEAVQAAKLLRKVQLKPGGRVERPLTGMLASTALAPVKNASITIRMSADDCEQLRSRAAEADMNVSAYLRSCIFEVESLRAQVKDAVAQMRLQAPPAPPEEVLAPAIHSAVVASAAQPTERFGWLRRLQYLLLGTPLRA